MATPDDLATWTGPLIGTTFLAGVAGGIALADTGYPRPGSDAAAIERYFVPNARSARLSAAGQFTSTAMLAAFTTSAARFAGRAGGPGLRAAALAGGALAAGALATSAALTAALAGRSRAPERTLALHKAAFAAGGPVHGAGFGLLVGALSLAGRRSGELPAALTATGLVSAAAGLASPAYFAFEPAGWLIPIGRFTGLIVSGVAGPLLGRRR
jgi:hypothetical protein